MLDLPNVPRPDLAHVGARRVAVWITPSVAELWPERQSVASHRQSSACNDWLLRAQRNGLPATCHCHKGIGRRPTICWSDNFPSRCWYETAVARQRLLLAGTRRFNSGELPTRTTSEGLADNPSTCTPRWAVDPAMRFLPRPHQGQLSALQPWTHQPKNFLFCWTSPWT